MDGSGRDDGRPEGRNEPTADDWSAVPPLRRSADQKFRVVGTPHRKVDAVADGFDPAKIDDPLFFLDGADGYVPLTPELHQRILAGEVRL